MDASNLLRLIRLQNIFAPQQPIGNDMPEQGGITGNIPYQQPQTLNQVEQQQPYSGMNPQQQQGPHAIDYGQQPNQYMDTPADPNSMMGQPVSSPYQHQNIDQLNRMIADYPVEQKPSKWRHVGAMLVGAGYGPEAAQKFLGEPYNKEVVAWKNKVGPVENAATQERIGNQNIRTSQISQEKQDLAEKKLTQDTANKEADRKIRADRAATYDFKTKHPNHLIKENDKGQLIAIDPQSGQTSILADENGEPIKSSILTDTDKINMQIEGRLKAIEATGKNQQSNIAATGAEARKTEADKEVNRQSDIASRGAQARTTKSTAGTTTGASKPLPPSQIKTQQYNKAREAYNSHPEWQQFIKLGDPGSNDFKLEAPGTSLFGMRKTGPADQEYQKMKDFIYATDQISPASSHQPASFPATTTNTPKAPKGWKYVPKQGGGWTAVKDE